VTNCFQKNTQRIGDLNLHKLLHPLAEKPMVAVVVVVLAVGTSASQTFHRTPQPWHDLPESSTPSPP
jgi:hypothetical protein